MADLILGPVTLALPLSADGYHIVGPDRSDIGKVWPAELAVLFAAAPDLLLAAELVVKESDPPADESDWEASRIRFGTTLDALRTAIARARNVPAKESS